MSTTKTIGPSSRGYYSDPKRLWWEQFNGFETLEDAEAQNRISMELAEDALAILRRSATDCHQNESVNIPLDARAIESLLRALEIDLVSEITNGSLASAVHMRRERQRIIGDILNALDEYADDGLVTATVIKSSWALTPEHLLATPAATIKNQLFTDLKRTGIASLPGPLIGFLHGEFEPTSGLFVLHFHIITTRNKGDALHRLKALGPYIAHAPGPTRLSSNRYIIEQGEFHTHSSRFGPNEAFTTGGGGVRCIASMP